MAALTTSGSATATFAATMVPQAPSDTPQTRQVLSPRRHAFGGLAVVWAIGLDWLAFGAMFLALSYARRASVISETKVTTQAVTAAPQAPISAR